MTIKRNQSHGSKHSRHSKAHDCAFCTIIPPHMTDHIIKHGDDEMRSWTMETMRLTEQFRGIRGIMGNMPSLAVSTGQKRRTVYDARQDVTLPGRLVRGEGGQASQDIAVNEAYDGAGATYDLYSQVYQRNSVDDRGLRIDSTVHYDVRYDNAFWNGNQMVYGDGDGRLFNRFTIAIDVIGHELTHGVVQFEAGLLYQSESGALNESFADVFGSLVKQRTLNQTAEQADWLIGAGLLAPGINGQALRSLKAPGTAYDDPMLGKDPQPALYANRYRGRQDNGGVHINSGIPNHAFYLAAIAIGGFAWEKAGRIWYIALRDVLRSRSTFSAAAGATIRVAGDLYGQNSAEQSAVRDAWRAVGVT
ncbi:M4 family metallopeptidase [Methylomicrobium sp. Wu6]|uniref:M4 family metallopeptidase n=1 Tax=Methylomicrobium sp. Wu6 TaxID=3107928 RepID=UPI002DD67189|nr:M4 family metallopeptidase [Methylomicrobium sp. Wu6]MEC4750636.1 M4 family metallopeptidase [Methylomicrobium sp. Wu6]